MFPSILTFNSNYFWGRFSTFGAQMVYLGVRLRLKNCFWVSSYGATTFIFYVSFNSEYLFLLNFRFCFCLFSGPNGLFLLAGWGSKSVWDEKFYFLCILQFWLLVLTQFLGNFLLFGALIGYFSVWGRVKKLFRVSSSSWVTFVFLCLPQVWLLVLTLFWGRF